MSTVFRILITVFLIVLAFFVWVAIVFVLEERRDRRKKIMQEREQARLKAGQEAALDEFPYDRNLGPAHKIVHERIRECSCMVGGLHRMVDYAFRGFGSKEEAYAANRMWIMKFCKPLIRLEVGILFDDKEMIRGCSFGPEDKISRAQIIADLSPYCDKVHVRRMLSRIGPAKQSCILPRGLLYKKKSLELLQFVQKMLPMADVFNVNNVETGSCVDYGFGAGSRFGYTYYTHLSEAVDHDDVELIRFLLEIGADPNVHLAASSMRMPDAPFEISDPLIMHIKSKRVFDLMATAGMNLKPTCGDKNLVDEGRGIPITLSGDLAKWRWEFEMSQKLKRK